MAPASTGGRRERKKGKERMARGREEEVIENGRKREGKVKRKGNRKGSSPPLQSYFRRGQGQ